MHLGNGILSNILVTPANEMCFHVESSPGRSCERPIQAYFMVQEIGGTGAGSKFGTIMSYPRNDSGVTKVYVSSSRTWQNQKMSYHPESAQEFFHFTRPTNTLRVFFARNCRF